MLALLTLRSPTLTSPLSDLALALAWPSLVGWLALWQPSGCGASANWWRPRTFGSTATYGMPLSVTVVSRYPHPLALSFPSQGAGGKGAGKGAGNGKHAGGAKTKPKPTKPKPTSKDSNANMMANPQFQERPKKQPTQAAREVAAAVASSGSNRISRSNPGCLACQKP